MILFFAGNRDLQRYFTKLAQVCNEPAKVHWCRAWVLPSLLAITLMPLDVLRREIEYSVRSYEYLNKKKATSFFILSLWLKGYFYFCRDYAVFKKEQPRLLVVWNGMMFRRSLTVAAAKSLQIPLCFMENGLLPNTTVCDRKGVNAGNSVPRDADFYRQYQGESYVVSDLIARKPIIEKQASKKPLPEKFIFVPFQVDTDSQILVYSRWIKNMQELFELILRIQKRLPHLRFVFKEHPSSRIDYRHLHALLNDEVGMFANDYSTQELIEKAQAVLTINSTVGIEALMFNKQVLVLGEAFYAMEGLVKQVASEEALHNALNSLSSFQFDKQLKDGFFYYLKHQYLLQGSWKNCTGIHISEAVKKIEGF